MKRFLLGLLFALWSLPAVAAVGTIYVDTGGATTNSGTTDQNTANFSSASVDASNTAGTTITLATNTNLSGLATDGSQAIFWNNATNSNQKIFWITGVTGCTGTGACSVTVSVATTCSTCGAGSWAIGGRMVLTPANYEAALRAGDTVIFNNSPATRTSLFFTARVAGDTATGYITIKGKDGVRPVFTVTSGTTSVISGGGLGFIKFSNLELKQQGTVADVVASFGANGVIDNVKISQGPANGVPLGSSAKVLRSEFTGLGGAGLSQATNNSRGIIIAGNYIHDNTGDGIVLTGTASQATVANNVIDTNGGRGIFFNIAEGTGAGLGYFLLNNTIYGNGNSGLEVSDTDIPIFAYNNIFQENGNAANEYNAEWTAGSAEIIGLHEYNLFFHSNCQGSGTGGPSCVSGLTVGNTEVSSDALFTDAANGDFSLQSTSPAKGVGYPGVLLDGSTGYMSMGAVQVQATASGGGHIIGSGL